jgi:hypothetical protein
MAWLGTTVAIALIVTVLIDTFEVMILPRRVSHPLRLARLFYRSTWFVWSFTAKRLRMGRVRNAFLGVYGPLSLFALLTVWAIVLIVAFALLHWSIGPPLAGSGADGDFVTHLYFSGATFFTLGFGDVIPSGAVGRTLSIVEAGLGFAFLAVVISYLPVLYQAFSRREIAISLLDARAGSPPTAGELLRRVAAGGGIAGLRNTLADWERWSAELLESHLSFPVLRYYRSQHDNQSWIGALTTILDTSALLIATGDGADDYQARLTFAMARHAAVDLSMVSQTTPQPCAERLPPDQLARLCATLQDAGFPIRDAIAVGRALGELRGLYEPFVTALSAYFLVPLPAFQPNKPPVDNWQTSAWMKRSPGLGGLPAAGIVDEHFD